MDPNRPRFAALVRLGVTREIRQAVRSVINNAQYFSELHIEYPAYSANAALYRGWEEDERELRGHNINIAIHAVFDANKTSRNSFVLVEIPGACDVRQGAIELLVVELAKERNRGVTHYAFEPEIDDPSPYEEGVLYLGVAFVWYGFFLAGLFVDWLRYVFAWGKYDSAHHMRATTLFKTHYGSTVPKKPFFRAIYNRSQAQTRFVGGGCVITRIPRRERGAGFTLAWLRSNQNVYVGAWLMFFALYYFFFAFPWWGVFLAPPPPANASDATPSPANASDATKASYVDVVLLPWRLSVAIARRRSDFFSPVSLVLYATHFLIMALVCVPARVRRLPGKYWLCLLHPLYLAALPAVWLYARVAHLPIYEEKKEKTE